MKVMFLDHDGVLCLTNTKGSWYKKWNRWCKLHGPTTSSDMPVEFRFDNFDKKSIKILNDIIEISGCEIVISSDWKNHCTLEEMKKYYALQGIIKSPIAFTENLKNIDYESYAFYSWKGQLERIRMIEIKNWIEIHSPSKWVVIDDMNLSDDYLKPGLSNFVYCKRPNTEGIKQTGLKEKIINYLI